MPNFNFSLKYNLTYEVLKLNEHNKIKANHSLVEERYLNPLPLIISLSSLISDEGYDIEYDFLKNINQTVLKVKKY